MHFHGAWELAIPSEHPRELQAHTLPQIDHSANNSLMNYEIIDLVWHRNTSNPWSKVSRNLFTFVIYEVFSRVGKVLHIQASLMSLEHAYVMHFQLDPSNPLRLAPYIRNRKIHTMATPIKDKSFRQDGSRILNLVLVGEDIFPRSCCTRPLKGKGIGKLQPSRHQTPERYMTP